jgi:hypothetical protein
VHGHHDESAHKHQLHCPSTRLRAPKEHDFAAIASNVVEQAIGETPSGLFSTAAKLAGTDSVVLN